MTTDMGGHITALLEAVMGRLDDQSRRLDRLDQRLDAIATQVSEVRETIATMRGEQEAERQRAQARRAAASERAADRRTLWQIAVAVAGILTGLLWNARAWLRHLFSTAR